MVYRDPSGPTLFVHLPFPSPPWSPVRVAAVFLKTKRAQIPNALVVSWRMWCRVAASCAYSDSGHLRNDNRTPCMRTAFRRCECVGAPAIGRKPIDNKLLWRHCRGIAEDFSIFHVFFSSYSPPKAAHNCSCAECNTRLLTRKPFDKVNFLKQMSHSYDRSFRCIRIWFFSDSTRRVWKWHSLHENCLSLLWQILCFFTLLAALNLRIKCGERVEKWPQKRGEKMTRAASSRDSRFIANITGEWFLWIVGGHVGAQRTGAPAHLAAQFAHHKYGFVAVACKMAQLYAKSVRKAHIQLLVAAQ